jgi:LysR family transcriptional regulator, transcription activator of glutamate synthase operon
VVDGEGPDLVRTGMLDLTFTELTGVGPGLDHVELLTDRFVVLVPPQHRLASLDVVALTELRGEDLVESSFNDACVQLAHRALRAAGVEPNVVCQTNDNPTRQRLVDAGLGCAVLPGLTVEPGLPNGAVVVDLAEDLHRVICLAWASDRTMSPALSRFVDTARAVIADLG